MEDLSEEQRIALEEKRQRSEKISRLMGPYLLKRYRMLNETCDVCENILLQSPQGLKYCVNCEEIENDKTYPSNCAVQQQFPKPQTVPSPQAESVSLDKLQTAVTSLHENSSVQQKFPKPLTVPSLQAESVLLAKLQTAVTSLHESSSVENSILQCQLIKAAADALLAVRRLSDTRSSSDTSVCENNS